MKITKLPAILASAAGAVFVLAASADATTLGYWRFEDSPGFLLDSSGNNLTLSTATAVGGTTVPAQYTLPGSGAGSAFPVPQSAASNEKGALFVDSNDPDTTGDGYLKRADFINFSGAGTTGFTIEAYINLGARDLAQGDKVIAANWDTNLKSWAFSVDGATGNLEMWLHNQLTGSGIDNTFSATSLTIQTGVDYYAALVFTKASANGTNNGSATFYLQDLTNGGTLQTQTVTHSRNTVTNTTADFTIGSLASGEANRTWIGVIDEVRLSDTALAQSQLLAVPEPGAAMMLLGGLGGLIGFRRVRRS